MFSDVDRDRILIFVKKKTIVFLFIFLNRLDKGHVFVHLNSNSKYLPQTLNAKS